MHWTLPRLIGITILLAAYSCSEGGKSSTPVSGSDALGPDVSDPGWPDANDDRDTFAPGPLACPEHADPQLETTLGCIRGTTNIVGEVFLAIPFAEPPVGDLRWRRPTPPKPWSAPFDATQLGPLCVQAMDGVFGESSLGDGEEDCLQLNSYRPHGPRTSPSSSSPTAGASRLEGRSSMSTQTTPGSRRTRSS